MKRVYGKAGMPVGMEAGHDVRVPRMVLFSPITGSDSEVMMAPVNKLPQVAGSPTATSGAQSHTKKGFVWKARYTVLLIFFMVWVLSFIDRMAISVAIPYVATDLGLSPVKMGVVLSAFFGAYTLAQLPGGILGDRFGARKIVTLALFFWSLFTFVTGLIHSLFQMIMVRFTFGLGEGVYPACAYKGISVWFPQKERATATALMMASNGLGAGLAPLIVVPIMALWGWRAIFYSFCVLGLPLCLYFGFTSRIRPSEISVFHQRNCSKLRVTGRLRPGTRAPGWTGDIIKDWRVWQFFLVYFAFDITLWGFTTWLPTYLVRVRGFTPGKMAMAASVPFLAGMIGCALGGWASDKFFSNHRRWLLAAIELISAALLYLTVTATSITVLIISQTLAGFFIKSSTSAFWALPMNYISKTNMGAASGFISIGAQLAAFISPLIIGYLIQRSGGEFFTTFAFLIGAALVSFLIVVTMGDKRQGDMS